MIHVFFLHSSITALVSRDVIRRIPPKDKVWVISARGDWSRFIPCDMKYTESQSVLGHPSLCSVSRRMRMLPGFRNSDIEIEKFFQSQQYHLYVPHTHSLPRQLLATHTLCNGFSYIEEGLVCYRSKYNLKRLEQTLAPIWSSRDIGGRLTRRCLGNRYFSRKASTAFAVSPSAFRHLKVTKEIIDLSLSPSMMVARKYGRAAVLALPYMRSSRFLPKAAQHNRLAIKQVAQLLRKSPYRKIYVRPHPSETCGAVKDVLYEISPELDGRLSVDDESNLLSEEICSVPDVTLISCGSSLSWYAKLLGAKTLSYANIMCEISPAFSGIATKYREGMDIDPEGTDIRKESWAS